MKSGTTIYRPYVQQGLLRNTDPRIIRSLIGSDKEEKAVKEAKYDHRFGSRPELLMDIPFHRGSLTKGCNLSDLPILANRSEHLGYEILAQGDLQCLGLKSQLPLDETAIALMVIVPTHKQNEILVAGLLLNHLDELAAYFALQYAASRTTIFAKNHAVLTDMPGGNDMPAYGRIAPKNAQVETLASGKIYSEKGLRFGGRTFTESYFPLFRDGDKPTGTQPVGMVAVAKGEAIGPELTEAHNELIMISGGLVLGITAFFIPINLIVAQRERELKSRRQEKEEADALKDTVLSSVDEGICGLDEEGKMVFVNRGAREILGAVSTGMHIGTFLPIETTDKLIESLINRRSTKGQTRVLSTEGNATECDYTLTFVDSTGSCSSTLTFRDITERIELVHEREVAVVLEAERRMTLDLHDGLVSTLTRLKTQVEAASRSFHINKNKSEIHLRQAVELALESLLEADFKVRRRLIVNGQKEDFVSQIERTVRTTGSDRLDAQFKITGEAVSVAGDVALALILVLQEGLKNVILHSCATSLEVELCFLAPPVRALTLTVEDNGKGFEYGNPTNGTGLSSMRQRMLNLGGSLKIESKIGFGTTLIARIPTT